MSQSKTVAILIAPRGTEDPEFAKPKDALEKAGFAVTVVGLTTEEAQTFNNDLDPASKQAVDKAIGEVAASDYDAVVVPGGTVGADKLRASKEMVAFVGAFLDAGKPVAAICHGPWLLVEADVVRGKTVTSWPSIRTDLRNAGGEIVDEAAAVDGNIITSRNPDDVPAFTEALAKALLS